MPFHDQYPGTFLEVGVGGNDFSPAPTPLVGTDGKVTPFNFTEDNRYIGIDTPLEPNRSWRYIKEMFLGGDVDIDERSRVEPEIMLSKFEAIKSIVLSYRPDENIDFIIADAEQLPFGDGSVSEVYMANVVGSQMRDEHLARILREARRVIGGLGRLTMRDNVTPGDISDGIDSQLQDAGFTGVARYMQGTREYKALVEQYGLHPYDEEDNMSSLDGLFMVAEVG